MNWGQITVLPWFDTYASIDQCTWWSFQLELFDYFSSFTGLGLDLSSDVKKSQASAVVTGLSCWMNPHVCIFRDTNWLFGWGDDKSIIRLQKYGMSDMGYLLAWLGSCLNQKSENLDRWSWIRLVNSDQPPPLSNFAHATMDELSTWMKLA